MSGYSPDSGALFSLAREVHDATDVTFDFSGCYFLSPEAVAFLGGLTRLIQHRGGAVYFAWDTLLPAVAANLAQNGFMHAFGGNRAPWVGNSVPYLEHCKQDPGGFSSYVQNAWLGRGWVGMSDLLMNQITSIVSEVYVNAFEHAASPVGLHCCGQFYPKMKVVSLTLIDFGVGVPFRVRSFKAGDVGLRLLSASQCLQWAFQAGASTRGGVAGGLGLANLCQFVAVNNGTLEYYSHDARATLRDGATSFTDCPDYFEGTMVTVRLRCDGRYYLLGSELASHNPFQRPS